MDDTDDALLARVATGDRAAFGLLFARHQDGLLAMTARVVGNRAIAEEIVQEAFTRAWVTAPRWRPADAAEKGRQTPFRAWLNRVATNLAIDHLRRPRFAALEAAAEPADETPAADAAMLADEDRNRLAAALAGLPPRQRAAIALTYDLGVSNAEGAAAMEISVGAFELLLVRARRSLRRAMMEDDTP